MVHARPTEAADPWPAGTNEFCRLCLDPYATTIYEGASEMQRVVVKRQLLGGRGAAR